MYFTSTISVVLLTLGAFEVAGAAHHGAATVEFSATEVLAQFDATALDELSISLVRVNGDNAPKGPVIGIREMRVEVTTEEDISRVPSLRGPGSNAYVTGR